MDLLDALSLNKAWLCSTKGLANLLASKVVLEMLQNGSSSNGDGQL